MLLHNQQQLNKQFQMAAYKTGVRTFEILYPVLENASEMDTPF